MGMVGVAGFGWEIEIEIPAFAGMTVRGAGMTGGARGIRVGGGGC